ncbi:MAG: tRNA lysidine(34) synthetase TilS [Firmicutes bacterium]|nr:tRNA lysidine(34) synthetase TilS [Bacillota bacterium]
MKLSALERRFLAVAQTLWDRGAPLVIGLSGGSDSMALYALLKRVAPYWPTPLYPVHINHQLRPEAGREAAWLQTFVKARWGDEVTVVAVTVDVGAHEGVEAAARRARYQALHQAADALGDRARILVAHQRDDQAETVLMRVMTGTGIRGLAGMAVQHGRVLRPLLDFSRAELRSYLSAQGIPWLDDPSNQALEFLRNRVRHEVLPLLARIANPRVAEALTRLADHARAHQDALEYLLQEWARPSRLRQEGEVLILAPEWRQWPEEVLAFLFRRHAEAYGLRLSREHLRQARHGAARWPRGWAVRLLPTGELWVGPEGRRENEPALTAVIPLPSVGEVPWGAGRIVVELREFSPPVPRGVAVVNGARWPRLAARHWQPGDRIHPLGMQGHAKKLQDVFVDARVPRAERPWWPVVVDAATGTVLALPGLITAEEARADAGAPAFYLRYFPGRTLE